MATSLPAVTTQAANGFVVSSEIRNRINPESPSHGVCCNCNQLDVASSSIVAGGPDHKSGPLSFFGRISYFAVLSSPHQRALLPLSRCEEACLAPLSTLPTSSEDATGRSALRKANFRLLPLLCIGYLIAYMDRVNVSFAALQMNQGLHFSASAYGLGAGLFFLSYAICEVPSNLLLVRVGARRWLSRIMFTWGLLSMAMMLVRTPREFYLVRLALGAAEAGFFPGIIFYISQWFPAAAQSRAISRFYVAIPLSSVVMGALAGMLLSLNGRLHLAGWQWLFLAEGLPAILMSILFLLYLPNDPSEARWLTFDERHWILNQLRTEAASARGAHRGEGLASAFREPRVWLLGTFLFCTYTGWYGVSFIMPTLIQKTTGFSDAKIGFAVALFGLLGAASMLFSGWLSDRHRERYFHTLVPTLGLVAVFLAIALCASPMLVLLAFALFFMFGMSTQPPVWSLPSTFLRGKSAAAGIAIINTMSICGGFIGPSWLGFMHDVTGTYERGVMTLAIPASAACIILLVVRQYSVRRERAIPN